MHRYGAYLAMVEKDLKCVRRVAPDTTTKNRPRCSGGLQTSRGGGEGDEKLEG